jgi:hypothetical protein
MKKIEHAFDPKDMKEFEPEAKVGLLATITPEGLPHITLITAIQAKDANHMIFGQFSEGLSKKNVKKNSNTGFLIMNQKMNLWRGKAKWMHEEKEGEDYEMFNKKPMYRYNAYFGIHTVHYMDLVETYGREKLPLGGIILGSLLTGIAKAGAKTGAEAQILKPWAMRLFTRIDATKFLSYVGKDGYPVIIPVLQCQAADSRRLVFSLGAYREELLLIPTGTKLAIFGMSLEMEDVLVRGAFSGYKNYRGITLGALDIEWVYNSMPPLSGQIYPEKDLKAVTEF